MLSRKRRNWRVYTLGYSKVLGHLFVNTTTKLVLKPVSTVWDGNLLAPKQLNNIVYITLRRKNAAKNRTF